MVYYSTYNGDFSNEHHVIVIEYGGVGLLSQTFGAISADVFY